MSIMLFSQKGGEFPLYSNIFPYNPIIVDKSLYLYILPLDSASVFKVNIILFQLFSVI